MAFLRVAVAVYPYLLGTWHLPLATPLCALVPAWRRFSASWVRLPFPQQAVVLAPCRVRRYLVLSLGFSSGCALVFHSQPLPRRRRNVQQLMGLLCMFVLGAHLFVDASWQPRPRWSLLDKSADSLSTRSHISGVSKDAM